MKRCSCYGPYCQGVRGMRIAENEFIKSLVVIEDDVKKCGACENGYGKRTPVDEFNAQTAVVVV